MEAEASRRMDSINRRTWRDSSTIRWFRRLEGWTDEGERAAFELVSVEAKDQPILDLGVGGGRTTPLLRSISRDYTAPPRVLGNLEARAISPLEDTRALGWFHFLARK